MEQAAQVSSWLLEGTKACLDDRGYTHGLGVFETMLVVDGVIFNRDAHVSRMALGCGRLGILAPDWDRVEDAVRSHCGEVAEGFVRGRVMRTAGEGGLGQLGAGGERTVLSLARWDTPPESLRVASAPWIRDERSPLAGCKCTSYADSLMALRLAKQSGVDEFLFANSVGVWSEGTTSNGFAVIDGQLVTPSLDSGCLPGTMRANILRWAGSLGLSAEESSISLAELGAATEMFLTSAIRGVVPVIEFDGRAMQVGPVTTALRKEWRSQIGLHVE